MFTIQIDKDVSLLLATPIYAESMFELINSEKDYLSEWMSWPNKIETVSDCKDSAKRMLRDYADEKGLPCYILYQGKLVGTVSFNTINYDLKRVEIGYWISSFYQGKGIITRACEKLIQIAFTDYKMTKVQISVAENNQKSRAVCERLGFELEGIIKNSENVNGRIINHAVYGLTNLKL